MGFWSRITKKVSSKKANTSGTTKKTKDIVRKAKSPNSVVSNKSSKKANTSGTTKKTKDVVRKAKSSNSGQPSGKQPNPVVTDVRENLDTWTKSPEGMAAAEDAKKIKEEFDLKQMNKQFEAAAAHGKEIVFEFSKPISSKANTYVSKLVKMLGGKRSYIEDQTKLVVVM